MTKFTIFTTCKPFEGIVGANQRSAITSWALIKPTPTIVLIGNEKGTAELAKEMRLKHIRSVTRNRWGTPLMSGLFWVGVTCCDPESELLCYVNSDILLFPEFSLAVAAAAAKFDVFLMSGPRWDLQVDDPINFKRDWIKDVNVALKQRGVRHKPTGLDWLAFTRKTYHPASFPALAIGRNGWDSWLLWKAIRKKIPTIDATQMVKVVHQEHGGRALTTEEHKMNRAMSNQDRLGRAYIWEATYRLLPGYHIRKCDPITDLWCADVGWDWRQGD